MLFMFKDQFWFMPSFHNMQRLMWKSQFWFISILHQYKIWFLYYTLIFISYLLVDKFITVVELQEELTLRWRVLVLGHPGEQVVQDVHKPISHPLLQMFAQWNWRYLLEVHFTSKKTKVTLKRRLMLFLYVRE